MRYALGLFSVLPVRPFDVDRRAAARAMAAFAWLGLLLGAVAGAALFVAWQLAGPLLGAALGLSALAILTGGLHLDGVADTADGLGSRRAPAEALAIMRKSDVGPMGVAALVLVLLVDAAALASLQGADRAVVGLVGAAAVARLGVTLATTSRRSARGEGFGALFVGATGTASAVVNALLVAAVLLVGAWWTGGIRTLIGACVAMMASALTGTLWARHLLKRLGGWTGDTFGSLIEVTQMAFLVAFALAS